MTARWPRFVVAAVALALVATGCLPDHPGAPYDFDGDGRADYVWVDHDGVWHSLTRADTPLWSSTTGEESSYVPGDYDGDGRMEPAAIDADGNWATAGGAGTIVFPAPDWPDGIPPIDGRNFVLPVPGRYDGGLRDLPAWYRDLDGTWFIQGQDPIQFGDGPTTPGDEELDGMDQDFPVPADYDGDGVTDLAVYNPRTGRYRIRSSIDLTISERTLLPTTDGDELILPVPADYDGVGHAQAAVWGNLAGWSIEGHDEIDPFGVPSMPFNEDGFTLPIPADHDGDGRTDLAVMRAGDLGGSPFGYGDGTWQVRRLWTPVTVPDVWSTNVPVTMPSPLLWNIARFTLVGRTLNPIACAC